jgi:4'-phosphopantetheinyl transferase
LLYFEIPPDPLIDFEFSLDIWQFNLAVPYSKKELNTLSEDEKTRAKRFYFDHHRHRFEIGRIRLRQILSQYLHDAPEKLSFHYEKHGKPYLNNALQFNLSHSRDLALLAICLNHSVGVDLEFYSPRPFLGIGQQVFSEKENRILSDLPKALKPLCFFHLWAQKEAVIKAVGTGLSYPTQLIQVPVLPPTKAEPIQTIDDMYWKIDAFSPALGARAAVCYDPSITKIRYKIYEQSY